VIFIIRGENRPLADHIGENVIAVVLPAMMLKLRAVSEALRSAFPQDLEAAGRDNVKLPPQFAPVH
jgi:hypothetical protein